MQYNAGTWHISHIEVTFCLSLLWYCVCVLWNFYKCIFPEYVNLYFRFVTAYSSEGKYILIFFSMSGHNPALALAINFTMLTWLPIHSILQTLKPVFLKGNIMMDSWHNNLVHIWACGSWTRLNTHWNDCFWSYRNLLFFIREMR